MLTLAVTGVPVFDLQKQLFPKVNISDGGILTIDPSLAVSECADDYARKLKEVLTMRTLNGQLIGSGLKVYVVTVTECLVNV